MKLSDRLMEWFSFVAVLPIELARLLPNRILRFIGIWIAFPFCFITGLASWVFLIAYIIVSIWEEAENGTRRK